MQEILLTLIFKGFLRAFLFGCPNLEFIVVAYIKSGVLEQPKETYQSNHSKNKSKDGKFWITKADAKNFFLPNQK